VEVQKISFVKGKVRLVGGLVEREFPLDEFGGLDHNSNFWPADIPTYQDEPMLSNFLTIDWNSKRTITYGGNNNSFGY
jgi:hypothetical protein